MVSFVLVINIYGLSGCHEVPLKLRQILSSRAMYIFMMTPCPSMSSPTEANQSKDGYSGNLKTLFSKPTFTSKNESVEADQVDQSKKQLVLADGTSEKSKKSKARLANPDKFFELVHVVEHFEKIQKAELSKEEMETIWKYVAVYLDRIFFFVNVFVIIGLLIGFQMAIYVK